MNNAFNKIFAIFWKDLLTELRTKEIIVSVLVFVLLVVVIFNFAFDTGLDQSNTVASGILWVALTFGGSYRPQPYLRRGEGELSPGGLDALSRRPRRYLLGKAGRYFHFYAGNSCGDNPDIFSPF